MICIRPVLTPASLAKFTISPVGFAHSLAGAKNSNHKILRKLNFSIRISYLLPTCQEKLMDELPAKICCFDSTRRVTLKYYTLLLYARKAGHGLK